MRILIISQFFPPEMGAPAGRFYDFAKYWIADGHEVSVVTSFPNFPTGVIPKQYRGKFYQKEIIEGIRVYRGYIYASPKLSFLSKTFGYISFVISSSLIILFAKLKYDIVISTSPPPMVGLPGIIASRLRRKPLVFDVRDIWPEALILSNRIRNPVLIKLLKAIEWSIYRCSSLITTVAVGKKKRLEERGICADKIEVVSNGVDIHLFDELSGKKMSQDLEDLVRTYRCITYAGVFNPAQGLDVVLDAAVLLRERCPDLYRGTAFVMIGDGSKRMHIEKRIRNENIENVFIMGIRPRWEVFGMLKRSLAILIPLRPRQDNHTVPSKIYESMASGRPLLLSLQGESVNIVSQAGGGLVSEAGDAEGLAENIRVYLSDPSLGDRHGWSARRYCAANYDRAHIAAGFLNKLLKTAGKNNNPQKNKKRR